MSDEVLSEEFEVLESIYPEELTKVSERELEVLVEPEQPISGAPKFQFILRVKYPEGYPDVYPEVSIEPTSEDDSEGNDLTSEEREKLLNELESIGNDNMGTAMTFTLVSHIRDALSSILVTRVEKIKAEEQEKERRALEEEEARTRGTPVTQESFLKWRAGFLAEQAEKKRKEDEERMKGWSGKEREEAKRAAVRLTGRQLFERGGPQALNLEDSSLFEEGAESVDVSLYDRTEAQERDEREKDTGVHLSDSD